MRIKLLSIFLSAMLLFLCACSGEAVSLAELPDPEKTVEQFFDYLKNEEYDKADKLVYNYTTLGMAPAENIDDPLLRAFCTKLGEHRSMTITEPSEITGKSAVMTIRVTTIDIQKIYEPLSDNVTDTIRDMRYRGEGAETEEEIAAVILNELNMLIEEDVTLAAADYFTVELVYTGGEWQIILGDDLYSALIGHAV